MASSERSAGVPEAFPRQHGLDGDWRVRFTADEVRARELAGQYRDAGYEVRVLPLFPDVEELESGSLERPVGADHDPLRETEGEACVPCLRDTYVLVTRRPSGGDPPAEPSDGLVYE